LQVSLVPLVELAQSSLASTSQLRPSPLKPLLQVQPMPSLIAVHLASWWHGFWSGVFLTTGKDVWLAQ
jgi:hypothetical protein